MKALQKWMDNPASRSILAIFGFRGPNTLHYDDPFEVYFQYKVGPYRNDYYLYFLYPPKRFGYILEVFDKMYEYKGYELVKYIEFHYHAYPDKDAFIRFLRYEALEQMRSIKKTRFIPWMRFRIRRARLAIAMLWLEEAEKRLRNPINPAAPEIPEQALAAGKEVLLDKIGEEVNDLLHSYLGKIELYNEHHVTKLIQLLHLLKDLRAAGKKGVPLFKAFSATDLAAILRQVEMFGDKKTNTLQVKIAEIFREMKPDDPAIEKLTKALQDFFF